MAKRYFAKCDLDDGRVIVNKGDELFLSDARPNWLHRDGHYVCHTTSNRMKYIEVREEKQGHIHADLMLQYAQDAQETPEPWSRWETNPDGRKWMQLTSNPSWVTSIQYRRKPKILSVTLANGETVSWPEPHCTELEYGDSYFFFVPTHGDIMLKNWDCATWDRNTLFNGYIHLTKKAAEQHYAAIRKINTQGRDDG